jgi:glutamine---fructose-6-phosphate transaminase (isomerizing)
LTVLASLAIAAAHARGTIDPGREAELSTALTEIPAQAAKVLSNTAQLRAIADEIARARDVLFLGRSWQLLSDCP